MRITSGIHKGRRINLPADIKTLRPTSDFARQAIFNMLQSRGGLEDLRVADICAGTGALGLEALSRGAAHATFVEHSNKTAQLIKDALTHWKETKGELLVVDALKLVQAKAAYDVIFIDPPYHEGMVPKILNLLQPKGWVQSGSLVIVEHDSEETIAIPEGFTQEDERRYGRALVKWLSVN